MKECHKVNRKKIYEIAAESVQNKEAILEAVVVASMQVLVFYGSLIYLNELVHQELGIPRSEVFKANSLLLGLWIVLPPCFGYIGDKFTFSYRKMMRFGAMGVFLSAPFLGLSLALACGWEEFQRRLLILNKLAAKYCCEMANIAVAALLQSRKADAVIIGLSPQNFAIQNCRLADLPLLEAQDLQEITAWPCNLHGDIYDEERNAHGAHAKIMKYNLNALEFGLNNDPLQADSSTL